VKRLVLLIILAVLIAVFLGSPASEMSPTGTSLIDDDVPDSEVTPSRSGTGNSPTSAIITITMYAVDTK